MPRGRPKGSLNKNKKTTIKNDITFVRMQDLISMLGTGEAKVPVASDFAKYILLANGIEALHPINVPSESSPVENKEEEETSEEQMEFTVYKYNEDEEE